MDDAADRSSVPQLLDGKNKHRVGAHFDEHKNTLGVY